MIDRSTPPTTESTSSVVVGVDDGLLRMRVLDRAVAEARRRDRSVRVVHVHGPAGPSAPWYDDAGERAVSYVSRTAPDLDVRRTCTGGGVAAALAAATAASGLLVVGDRHRRLGSEAGRSTEELVVAAPCPVLVIGELRDPPAVRAARRRLVVVGVDGSAAAQEVLLHGLRFAEVLGEPVEVVQAVGEATDEVGEVCRGDEIHTHEAAVDELLAPVRARVPGVPVSVVVAEDRPARLLRTRARGADLVVVGHRGRGAGTMLGLGSTTRSLLVTAPCPVLVLGPRVTTGEAAGEAVGEVEEGRALSTGALR